MKKTLFNFKGAKAVELSDFYTDENLPYALDEEMDYLVSIPGLVDAFKASENVDLSTLKIYIEHK